MDCIHPPTSLVYLAGVLIDSGMNPRILDANALGLNIQEVRDIIIGYKPNYVIFRSTPSTFYDDILVAHAGKLVGAITIMLNWNLHNVPDKVYRECKGDLDYYVNRYHYEYLIRDILLQQIKDYKEYETTDIPVPPWNKISDFSLFYTRTRYFSPWAVIRGSKGCGYRCAFCHPAGTIITGIDNKISIENVSVGDKIKGRVGVNEIVKIFNRKSKTIIKIETVDGKFLENTPEDPIWTKRGWVLAKDLREDDEVLIDE